VTPAPNAAAQFAQARGLAFEHRPDEAWFRRWEPHDAITPPELFFNACTWVASPGAIVLVEPWYASEDTEPLARTVLAFVTHPAFTRRAAMRVGEHFLTRVAYLESAPPPTVKVGDKVWDDNVVTLAASGSEAAAAFHPRLRKLLAGWGFQGHLEIRPGGLVLYFAGIQPTFEGYDRLLRITKDLVSYAISPR
jgi:hypothetical protein